MGYALARRFWRCGYTREAGAALIKQLRRDGAPYVTATHDRNNPRSGHVMRALGMLYCYSYEEQWQPKDFPVVFRLYQLNLDGRTRIYAPTGSSPKSALSKAIYNINPLMKRIMRGFVYRSISA